nr:MAG TPA: hypothetical protein [Caudoviricetes sp.]
MSICQNWMFIFHIRITPLNIDQQTKKEFP